MAKWWEELLDQQPPQVPGSRLGRTPDFFERQQAVEDELFRRDRENDSQTQRALNQSGAQIRAALPAVRGLARTLIGDEEGGREDLLEARGIIDREAQFAPDIQTLEDIENPGDALAYGRNAVLSNLPTVIPSIAAAVGTGGLSAAVGAGLRQGARRGLAGAIGRNLTYRGGQAAGALAGSSVMQTPQMLDAALDEESGDTARQRAAKAVVGAVTTGALDALPQISLLNRIGLGGAAKRAVAPQIASSLRKRMATEAWKQALQEGSTEAIQTLGENLTHKWVNDNIEVLGPDAYMQYLNAFVAGGLVGGVMGPVAGLRGPNQPQQGSAPGPVDAARERVRQAYRQFTQRDTAPRPAAEFDQPGPGGSAESAGNFGTKVRAAAETIVPGGDLGAKVRSATDTIRTEGSRAAGVAAKLFGKFHAEYKDEDFNSDFDTILERFRTADQFGRATTEDRGLIGRGDTGIVRGDIPFNGFSLFNPDQAESLWQTARSNGSPISTFQAFALSALPPNQVSSLGKEPIRAAALYLATGDRSAVNEDAMAQYLHALPSSDQQMQFLFAADRISEMVQRGREAAGGPVELTPRDVRQMVSGRTDPLRTKADIDDKANFDLAEELGDGTDLGDFADFQQRQAMDTERPAPVALHETISAKDFSRMSFGDRTPDPTKGEVAVTNSKGNRRTVKLASLVARGWQEVRNGTFEAPNGVVDVVAQAIDTIRQKGMNISPEAIRPGLWLGGKTKLTPAQAKAIRDGMQTTEAQRPPVQETPGLPNVPPGDRPFDASAILNERPEEQGEDGIENMTGDEQRVLRARTRSPLGTRVSPEGRLQEAETIDTEAADDIRDDQRRAESDAIAALHRANEIIAPGTRLKGNSLQQLMENFGKRARALKSPSKKQKEAIDGARRAIRRMERTPQQEQGSGVPFDPAEKARNVQAQRAKEDAQISKEAAQPSAEEDQVVQNALGNEGFAKWKAELAKKPAASFKPEFATRMTASEMRAQLAAVNRSIERDSARGILQTGLFYERAELEHMLGATSDKARFDLDFEVDDLIEDGKTFGDIGREQAMMDALTARLGIERISVRPMPVSSKAFGSYRPSTRELFISSKRQGNARIDTLLHELGHAIIHDSYEALSATDKKALDDAYRQWLAENYNADSTDQSLRKSRAPFFLKKWLDDNRGRGRDMSSLTDEQVGYVLAFDEFLADHLSRALGKNPETQGVIAKFFNALAEKLRQLYEIFSGSKYEPAEAVERWVESLLRGQMAQVINAQTVERQHQLIEQYYDRDDTPKGPPPANPPPIQPNQASGSSQPSQLFYLLNKVDRERLERALRAPRVFEQVYNSASPEQQRRLDQYGPDLVTMIDLAAALHAKGELKLDNTTALTKLVNFSKKMLGLPSNQDVSRQILADFKANQIRRGRYDGEARSFDRNAYTRAVMAVQRGVRNTVQPLFDRFSLDVGRRMRNSMVPALRRASALFESRVGENVGEQSFVATRQQFFSQLATQYMEAIQGLKDADKRTLARALQANKRPEGALGESFDKVRGLYQQLFNWARSHGVELRFRRDYFPIVMDRKRIEDDWDGMRDIFLDPKYAKDIRAFFKDTKTPMNELADRLVQIAQTADVSHVGEVEFALGIYEPSMNAQRAQIMGFLDTADREKLAKFQVDSLDAITLGYINQLAKKAAFVRAFGKVSRDKDGQPLPNRLGLLRQQAQRQGANKQDLQLFDDFAKMMLGSYNAELNPALRWVFSKVDKVFDKNLEDMTIEEWAHYQQVVMTYNNFRLLALAPLSSLIDSLGTLARGGSLTDSAKSIWDGIRAMRTNGGDLREMAETLGIIERYAMSDALAATYGGQFDPQGKLGRLNNALFKYNGLEAITRHSRLAALAMGHRFLLRHAQKPSKHSARLLKELQLTADDVIPDPNNPKFVQMTPKVEAALRRFVFESVVRPQPSQRPGWHNDPNFQFAAQYKGYLYAFYTTIVERMIHEARQGNYSQAIIPMVPYLAVTVAAEMLRYAIQHPGEDDPRDAAEYMQLAAIRSGLVGPRFGVLNDARTDTRYGNWLTNSWIGPSGQQAADLISVAKGERSFGRTAVEALPGSAIFEDWTWGPTE